MHPKGTSFRAPPAKFFARLDLEKRALFQGRHFLGQDNVNRIHFKRFFYKSLVKCYEFIGMAA